MMIFESLAERKAYPIINTLAIKLKIKMEYQVKFGGKINKYRSRKEFCRKNHLYYSGSEYGWHRSYFYRRERYRADFVLTNASKSLMLVIEIDGKQFHNDLTKEKKRDNYMISLGYDVIHLPASLVDSFLFRDKILELIVRYTKE